MKIYLIVLELIRLCFGRVEVATELERFCYQRSPSTHDYEKIDVVCGWDWAKSSEYVRCS